MNLDRELAEEAMTRGAKAAVVDAKAHETTAAIRTRLVRLFEPGLAQKNVTYRKFNRDANTQELTDDRAISRSALQDELDEFSGYVHVLTGWIDALVSEGKMTIGTNDKLSESLYG